MREGIRQSSRIQYALNAAVNAAAQHGGTRIEAVQISAADYRLLWADVAVPDAWTDIPPPWIDLYLGGHYVRVSEAEA